MLTGTEHSSFASETVLVLHKYKLSAAATTPTAVLSKNPFACAECKLKGIVIRAAECSVGQDKQMKIMHIPHFCAGTSQVVFNLQP